MRVELVIFDLDGTLVDSRKDIVLSVNHSLRSLELPELSEEKVSDFVGRGVTSLIRSVLRENQIFVPEQGAVRAGPEQKIFKKAIKLFKEHYAGHLLDHTVLFPGVEGVLADLKNYRKAVITNKPKDFSVKILEGLKVLPDFSEILGGDFGGPKKPAPDGLILLMEKLGTLPEKTMIVGDSVVDIEAGRNAKVRSCAVIHGFGKHEDLRNARPDFLLKDIRELPGLLTSFEYP